MEDKEPTPSSTTQQDIGYNANREKHKHDIAGFYPSVVSRYFTSYFPSPAAVASHESKASLPEVCGIKILFHSNKLCVVTLSPNHPALSSDSRITDINFQVTEKCNRFKNTVSGKRKRGAQWLNPESPLCLVTTNDGTVHVIRSGIRGNLIEVNDRLRHSPELLTTMPETEGYIAIVMIKINEAKQIMDGLVGKDEHEKMHSTLT